MCNRKFSPVFWVALLSLVFSISGEAFAQSKVSVELQHVTYRNGTLVTLAGNDVWGMYWPGGYFGNKDGASLESSSDTTATFNYGFSSYGTATLYWRSPFAQEWVGYVDVKQCPANSIYVEHLVLGHLFHQIVITNASGNPANTSEFGMRFGKAGHKTKGTAWNTAAFNADTLDITAKNYFPYIGMGGNGAYALYVYNVARKNYDEYRMEGDLYGGDVWSVSLPIANVGLQTRATTAALPKNKIADATEVKSKFMTRSADAKITGDVNSDKKLQKEVEKSDNSKKTVRNERRTNRTENRERRVPRSR